MVLAQTEAELLIIAKALQVHPVALENEGMPERRGSKSVWVGAEKYIQLGMTLPAATLVGWALGELLKRWLHYDWLPLAGLILGVIAGFVHFIRVALAEFKE